jgi:GDP-L-fucose synthase
MNVLVTGGSGFLGSHLVEGMRADGSEPFVARRRDYDLTSDADVERLFEDAQPELVVHLAAEVGGIGANRANPGRFWYANLLMGTHVLEQSRRAGVSKLVLVGTICSYPKFTPVPFKEEDL